MFSLILKIFFSRRRPALSAIRAYKYDDVRAVTLFGGMASLATGFSENLTSSNARLRRVCTHGYLGACRWQVWREGGGKGRRAFLGGDAARALHEGGDEDFPYFSWNIGLSGIIVKGGRYQDDDAGDAVGEDDDEEEEEEEARAKPEHVNGLKDSDCYASKPENDLLLRRRAKPPLRIEFESWKRVLTP
ncbi:hypothetical protein TSAR_015029 [Trichomalopsis sarcophagae]|uniref:Uncharacterized protein n=1 Tax=Trichomalopsis sarcophagae TaxID=543379 RepID=A0A232FEQ4_9HYME|nr:hypothetical protein TSAR_015029 [Trichomalopsis sarcophagae]